MKKHFCVAVIIAIVFLSGCEGKPIEPSAPLHSSPSSQTEQEPSPSSEVSAPYSAPDVVLQTKKFQLEEVSGYIPTVSDGKALFADPHHFQGEPSKNTIELELSTGNVTKFNFFLPHPKADDTYYYGIPLEDNTDTHSGRNIVRIRKETEEQEVLYTIDPSREFIPLLTYDNGYLLWTEYVFDENDTFSHWEIFRLNCSTLEVNLITETNYIFGFNYALPASNGYLPICKELDLGWNIGVYQVESGQVVLEHKIKGPTYSLCYDGTVLAWTEQTPAVYHDALHVLSLESGEERVIRKTTGAVDVKLYKSNYLVYVQDHKIKVYDLPSDTVVYDSTTDENLVDTLTLSWFSMDSQGGVAAFISGSTINKDLYYLTILPLYELNG